MRCPADRTRPQLARAQRGAVAVADRAGDLVDAVARGAQEVGRALEPEVPPR
jgi:hypothetical protein